MRSLEELVAAGIVHEWNRMNQEGIRLYKAGNTDEVTSDRRVQAWLDFYQKYNITDEEDKILDNTRWDSQYY